MAVFAASGFVFVVLTGLAREAVPNELDLSATRWLQQWANPALTWLMLAVSWPGFSPQSYVLPLVVAGVLLVRGLRPEAVWLLGSQVAPMANLALKELIHRPRPSGDLVSVYAALHDYSFPSGHVVQYTSLFGFAFFLAYVLARQSWWRSVLLVILGALIVLVAPSRMYLGQHWLSDVLGGYAVATLVLVPYCAAYTRVRLRSGRRGSGKEPSATAYTASSDETLAQL